MKNFKILIPKILLLFLLLAGMNFLYRYIFLPKDLQEHSDIVNLIKEMVRDSCEIVYVGESSNITVRWDDRDKRAISNMIADYFPAKKMGDMTKAASHAGIYYEMLRNIPENSTVKTVIVTMNLRSFDAGWRYSHLETPLQKSIVLLKKRPALFNRFMLSFKGYEIQTDEYRDTTIAEAYRNDILKFPYPFPYKTVDEWDKARALTPIVNPDSLSGIDYTSLACNYIKTFAFQIDTLTNPRIKDFDHIVSLAKKRGWKLIFNLMAENMEKVQQLLGDDLLFLMRQNRDLLLQRYNKDGVMVVDNLDAVPNEEFIDQDWTTEHYAQKGRRIVASNVAQNLKSIYSADYKEFMEDNNLHCEFFCDCEIAHFWLQWQTVTDELSYSPHHASKIAGGNPYSVTFEYPIKYLPDSMSKMQVEMYVYQTTANAEAQIIMQVDGNDSYSLSYPVSSLLLPGKTWQKINCTFPLEERFYKNDRVKFFLHNRSWEWIYIDDILVKFE
ncbi:MAG: hypothetical protein LBK03_04750 [Bacteroidales bacterium]|jgi:hypothetical protein|nr:hypothetical protein [Bacteroidales bacterium]